MTRITVLNECFLTPAHMDQLRQMGEVVTYADTATEDEVIARLSGATIALTDGYVAPFTARVFAALPNLRAICLNSVGLGIVDTAAAQQYGVQVLNLRGVFTEATAEYTFAMMLASMRNVIKADAAYRAGAFEIDPGNTQHHADFMGQSLNGKTLGIIGLGAIGSRVAALAQAFGMKVIAHTRTAKTVAGVTLVDLPTLLAQSDVITVHTNLNDSSRGMIDAAAFSQIKRGAVFICTTRNEVMDLNALQHAMQAGVVSRAAVDVHPANHPVFALPGMLLAPHIGGFSRHAYDQIGDNIVQNVQRFMTAGSNLAKAG